MHEPLQFNLAGIYCIYNPGQKYWDDLQISSRTVPMPPPPPCNVDTMLCLSTVQMIPVALNIVWGEGGFIKIAKTA